MALIKSSLLSAIRGSIGGTTYATNRYGMYARNRTVLANPNTGNQILARGSLGNSAQGWALLSADQQLGWINYASGTPVPNRLGDMIHMSGINAFVKQAALLTFFGAGSNSVAPTTPGLAPSISEVSALIQDDSTVAFDDWIGGDATAPAFHGVWISAPVSPGVTFFKGPWTYLGSAAGTGRDGPFTIPFPVVAGMVFFVRIRYAFDNTSTPTTVGKVSPIFVTGPILAVAAP